MNKYQEALYGLVIVKENFIYHEGKMIQIKNIKNAKILQELVDKATPKKPIYVNKMTTVYSKEFTVESCEIVMCPTCNKPIDKLGNCCSNNECRQALDWSKE